MKNLFNKVQKVFSETLSFTLGAIKLLREAAYDMVTFAGIWNKSNKDDGTSQDANERMRTHVPDFSEICRKVEEDLEDMRKWDDRPYVIPVEEDEENSSITVRDEASGANVTYRSRGRFYSEMWEYESDVGTFRCESLRQLITLIRGESSAIGGMSVGSGSLIKIDNMTFTGVEITDVKGRNVSLGKIVYRGRKWIWGAPLVDPYYSQDSALIKSFPDQGSAWNYATMYITCMMRNYVFPMWAAHLALFIDNHLFGTNYPETYADRERRSKEKDGDVVFSERLYKTLLWGAWSLILYGLLLIFAYDFFSEHPWKTAAVSLGLPLLYVSGIMKLLPSSYIKHRMVFIDRERTKFPLIKSVLWWFPAGIVVVAVNELMGVITTIKSAILDAPQKEKE